MYDVKFEFTSRDDSKKGLKCFFTYIQLDLFRCHPSSLVNDKFAEVQNQELFVYIRDTNKNWQQSIQENICEKKRT